MRGSWKCTGTIMKNMRWEWHSSRNNSTKLKADLLLRPTKNCYSRTTFSKISWKICDINSTVVTLPEANNNKYTANSKNTKDLESSKFKTSKAKCKSMDQR